MKTLRAFGMALGLYTALPGFARWDEEAASRLPMMLPPVGLLLGALWACAAYAAARWLPPLLGAVAAALAMPLLTGLLHLDGFMDVADALLSRRGREEKLRILKDPHTGAFAVISVLCLLLTQAGAADGLLRAPGVWRLLLLPVLARSMAGYCLMTLPPLSQSGYARMHYAGATRGGRLFCALCAVLSVGVSCLWGWRTGVSLLAAACAFSLACRAACRALGGMNGDIAGWSICWAELVGLLCLACM